MTAVNRHLADRASELAKGADGLRRRALLCVAVACASSTTTAGASKYLNGIELPDVRAAALQLLDELAAERTTP